MSAMNVIVQSNSVHLLTDALAYHPDGEIVMIGPKAVPMSHLNCAVAMRGPAGMRPVFAELIGNGASTFDGLEEIIVELLEAGARNYAPLFDDCRAGPDFEVLVAGISESSGPRAYLLATHDRYGAPWEIRALDGVTCLPNDEYLHAQIQKLLPGNSSADDLDPAADGVAILKTQRSYLQANNGIDGKFCAVGGFGQLTSVYRDRIESRIIHQWPNDAIGSQPL